MSPKRRNGGAPPPTGDPGAETRRLACDALDRIDAGGAYANLVLGQMLDRATEDGLERRDAALVTELVYGTTRHRRALDHRIEPFLYDEVEPRVRNLLRLGAYQLHHTDVPDHAAVSATVSAAPKRVRGLVNAVLRRVGSAEVTWPSDAVAWSYPDWIVERLRDDLGAEAADRALLAMNERATTNVRDDGYVQDGASIRVVDACEVSPGELAVDLCAAPGGKATDLARRGARVVAGDLRPSRVRLLGRNVARLEAGVAVLTADGVRPPLRPGSVDVALVDAPCSGLGSLRRRPDARWRIDADAPARLGRLQVDLVDAAADLVRPGGRLVYSVCTLTSAELDDVVTAVMARRDDLVADPIPDDVDDGRTVAGVGIGRWLPDDDDGMGIVRFRRR